MSRWLLAGTLLLVILTSTSVAAQEQKPAGESEVEIKKTAAEPTSVESLIKAARDSVVVITVTGRDGTRASIGTGFVISADGLIATNLHVVGEARPINIEFASGTRASVTEVHASDRALDLAVLRVDLKDLKPLELGDSDTLLQGQPVVAMGNPQGLEHSVVTGTVSATREIEGRKLIQLAIPIEPGNSGGPLLDMSSRVHGLLTMKSAVTANLGFAVPSNSLRPLLDKPNPIPIDRWLTIGALDPRDWTQIFGAQWRQRAGRIQVTGPGAGFGARTLCLSKRDIPEQPYEVAVTVKLDDEAGAAGLIFAADGEHVHYGFYPSNRRLRLTRFEGPDVFSWTVLEEKVSADYRPGDWNTLKVRHEEGRILCYVNGQLAITSTDAELTGGSAGLASFRGTKAEFKQFRIGKEIRALETTPEALAAIDQAVALQKDGTPTSQAKAAAVLGQHATAATPALRERAKRLERDAQALRELADQVHQRSVIASLVDALQGEENDIDLFHAALLISKLDNEDLEIEAYQTVLERMAGELRAKFRDDMDARAKIAALNEFLFTEGGFHGSRADYYNRSNSYLNEVLDDREGLPITLSVLYMELARRVGLNVVGVPLPGHFVVRHIPAEGEPQLIDVYEGGHEFSRDEAAQKLATTAGIVLQNSHLEPATKRAIVLRMLNNLLGIARGEGDAPAMLRYLQAILAVDPNSTADRGFRAALLAQLGRTEEAIADLDDIIQRQPEGIDLEQVRKFRDGLEQSQQ